MSIVNQSYKNWELLIVDDGSNDKHELENVVMKFDDPRITFDRIEHSGVVWAQMFGYQKAQGDLMTVQAADDLSMPDRLEKAVRVFAKWPKTDVFSHSLYVNMWHPETRTIFRTFRPNKIENDLEKRLLTEQTINGVPIFRRHVIKKKPLREETKDAYDWMQMLDWVFSGFKFQFSKVALYEYVRHQNSLSERNEKEGKRHTALLRIKEIMRDEYQQEFTPKDWTL